MIVETPDPNRTLWELAETVYEEVERVCPDQAEALQVSNRVLIAILQRHVRNVELVWEPPFRDRKNRGCTLEKNTKKRPEHGRRVVRGRGLGRGLHRARRPGRFERRRYIGAGKTLGAHSG